MNDGPHLLLCMDTSGSHMMLALYNMSDNMLADKECGQTVPDCLYQQSVAVHSQRSHSAMLVPCIQKALAGLQTNIHQLSGIAINVGPGSFTGLRSGISTARTLGQFLQCPVYEFNLFQLLTKADLPSPTAFLIDARKNQAYTAVIQPQQTAINSAIQPLVNVQPPQLLPLEAVPLFAAGFPKKTHWIVSPTLKERLLPFIKPDFITVFEEGQVFTPERMAVLCQQSPPSFKIEWQALLPLYLQEPNATLRKPLPGRLA